MNNFSGICATSYSPKCFLDMHSLVKSYFSLDIKEVFGYNNETGFIDFSTHVELHFDKSNKDLKIFSGQDENGNSIYLILKEGKCSNYNVKDKP